MRCLTCTLWVLVVGSMGSFLFCYYKNDALVNLAIVFVSFGIVMLYHDAIPMYYILRELRQFFQNRFCFLHSSGTSDSTRQETSEPVPGFGEPAGPHDYHPG
jgi:hypothetical protein